VTLTGTLAWDVNYGGEPASPGPDPIVLKVSEPSAQSLAVATTAGSTGRQSMRLTKDAFVAIHDVDTSFHLGAVPDDALGAAILARVRTFGLGLDAHGEALAILGIGEPGQRCCGSGGSVVDGTSVDVRPILGCSGGDCGHKFRVTFTWTGTAEVVDFEWELESSILSYGAPIPADASAAATISDSWAVPADAPILEATLSGDFDVSRRGDWPRKLIDYTTTLSPGAAGKLKDPIIPWIGYLTLRAEPDPGAGPTETLDLQVQNTGTAHVPLDGTPVTLALVDPFNFCTPGQACKNDGLLVFFRENELGDGGSIKVAWELRMRATSFDDGPLPSGATIDLQPRNVSR
jgi:hypothetical protein